MAQRFKEGDLVQYKDPNTQSEQEEMFPTPYSVYSSKMEDIYGSGLPEDCWEEIVCIQDSNDKVFDEVEADDLCKITQN